MIKLENNDRKEAKFLHLTFRMQDGNNILIQCKSDDKMEDIINKFCTKATLNKEEFGFNIVRQIKISKMNSTVEENGLIDKNDFISVYKKIPSGENKINVINNDVNKKISSDDNEENEKYIVNNEKISKKVDNIKILGSPIYLHFNTNFGFKFVIVIGSKNTFKDAAIKFCQCCDIPISVLRKDVVFIHNASKLDPLSELTFEQMRLITNIISITVIEQGGIIGA